MAVVELIARHCHIGAVETLRDGDLRPVCQTCSYKGPRYNPVDHHIALAGIEAHVATVEGGDARLYKIVIDTHYEHELRAWFWNWENQSWQ